MRSVRESFLGRPPDVLLLALALTILNFLPLPWNNNWFYLQAAPAFSLTGGQKAMLDRAVELLKKAETLQRTDLAEKLAQIVQGLQDGSLSRDEFSRSLSDLHRVFLKETWMRAA